MTKGSQNTRFGRRIEETSVNEQKTFELEKLEDERKRGERGLGNVDELWVNKACCGDEERDS